MRAVDNGPKYATVERIGRAVHHGEKLVSGEALAAFPDRHRASSPVGDQCLRERPSIDGHRALMFAHEIAVECDDPLQKWHAVADVTAFDNQRPIGRGTETITMSPTWRSRGRDTV